jgi:hypothetical protein
MINTNLLLYLVHHLDWIAIGCLTTMLTVLLCQFRAWLWFSALRLPKRKLLVLVSTVVILFLGLSIFFLLPSAILEPQPIVTTTSEETKAKNWLVNRADSALEGWKRIHNLWEENQREIDEARIREDKQIRERNAKGLPVTVLQKSREKRLN